MRSATAWFDLYGESHKNKINKAIHWICIPLILLATLGLIQALGVQMGDHLGLRYVGVAVALCMVFYARLSWTIFAGMTLVAGASRSLGSLRQPYGVPYNRYLTL